MNTYYVTIERTYTDIEVYAEDEDSALEKAMRIVDSNPSSYDEQCDRVESSE